MVLTASGEGVGVLIKIKGSSAMLRQWPTQRQNGQHANQDLRKNVLGRLGFCSRPICLDWRDYHGVTLIFVSYLLRWHIRTCFVYFSCISFLEKLSRLWNPQTMGPEGLTMTCFDVLSPNLLSKLNFKLNLAWTILFLLWFSTWLRFWFTTYLLSWQQLSREDRKSCV